MAEFKTMAEQLRTDKTGGGDRKPMPEPQRPDQPRQDPSRMPGDKPGHNPMGEPEYTPGQTPNQDPSRREEIFPGDVPNNNPGEVQPNKPDVEFTNSLEARERGGLPDDDKDIRPRRNTEETGDGGILSEDDDLSEVDDDDVDLDIADEDDEM